MDNRGTDLLLSPVNRFALIWLVQLLAAAGAGRHAGGDDNVCVQGNMFTTILETTVGEANCVVLNSLSDNGEIKRIDYYKCNSSGQCDKLITNSTNEDNDSSEIKGLNMKNCSSINDIITSGSYPVANKNTSVCRFVPTADVTATALNQKPTLVIPPLTESHQTTLTCTAAGLCSGSQPNFTWLLTAAGQEDIKMSENIKNTITNVTSTTQNHTSTLNINASAEHHNKKITCRVTMAGHTIEETQTLKVNYFRGILRNSSKCEVESKVVTCVCVSEGFPLPTIRWPLLKNTTKHTIITNVSDHLVTSTMTVKDPNRTIIRCVSSYNESQTKDTLNITKSRKSPNTNHPDVLQLLKEIVERPLLFLVVLGTGILIGTLLSAIVVCLAVKCHRKKKSRNLDESLEMVMTDMVSKRVEDGIQDLQDVGIQDLQDVGIQDLQDVGIQDHEAAGGGDETADSNEAKDTLYSDIDEADAAPRETVYSDINFSVMKEKSPADLNKEDTPETEYAEIKKGEIDRGNGDAMEDDDDKVVMMEEEEQSLLVEEGVGEDVPLYSTVDEAMDEN